MADLGRATHVAIAPSNLAHEFGHVLGFGSTPETWLRLQANYELAEALKSGAKIHVRRYHVAAARA